MQVRQAKREDIEETNRLTLQMHKHLGKLVGIEFSSDVLEEEFLDESDSLGEVYVAEVNGKVVGYISFSEKIREDERCGRYLRLYHLCCRRKTQKKGLRNKAS